MDNTHWFRNRVSVASRLHFPSHLRFRRPLLRNQISAKDQAALADYICECSALSSLSAELPTETGLFFISRAVQFFQQPQSINYGAKGQGDFRTGHSGKQKEMRRLTSKMLIRDST